LYRRSVACSVNGLYLHHLNCIKIISYGDSEVRKSYREAVDMKGKQEYSSEKNIVLQKRTNGENNK
jgi:hypothetical protein